MYPHRLVSQALRLGLLVTVLVLALSACGGDEKKAKPRPLPEHEKALQPGEYRSEEFEPSLSFRVGNGWTNVPPESSEFLALQRGVMGGVYFFRVKEVYEPVRKGMPNDVVEAPKDPKGWVAWGRHHPYLRTSFTSEPERVEVGGVKGLQVAVVVGDLPKDYQGRCGTNCVDIGRVEGVPPLTNDVFLPGDDKGRVTFLDVEGETVTISISGPANVFDDFVPEAQKVLNSVEWRGS
jgi:hypothetical protein